VQEEALPPPSEVAPAPARTPGPVRRPLGRRILMMLAFMGPGIIAANAGNDAGGIATYASAGAIRSAGPLPGGLLGCSAVMLTPTMLLPPVTLSITPRS